MKNRIYPILICSLVSWNAVFSQTHFVSLNKQKADFVNKSFNVTKVLDERSDKSTIGFAQKGMMNARVDANFVSPFEKELMDFLRSNLNQTGPKIHVVVTTLKISEKTGFSKERGFCELSVNFLVEHEAQVYNVLQTSITTEVSGVDVTNKHPKNIADAFKVCFDRLAGVDLSDVQKFLAIAPGESVVQIFEYDYPVFKETIKDGIYASYEELKNNAPSIVEEFVLDKKPRLNEPWTGTFEIIPRFKDTGKKVRKVWGIAYEGQVYVYHQKEFFPLIIQDYELYFYGYGIPDGGSISTGAFIGGLIGAGIASGIENANARKQKVKYYLDPNTGGQGKTILESEVR
ncbi:MAG: hypothetical protein KF803_03815 [Cyclobacteriaceae bacterium]|nr:hypothetical protein [Cyclobacteriaceae bacterium]